MGSLIIIIVGLAATAFLIRKGVQSYRQTLKTGCSGECGSCSERNKHGDTTVPD